MKRTLIKLLRYTSNIAVTGLILILLTSCGSDKESKTADINTTDTDTKDTETTETTIETPVVKGIYQGLSQEKAKELIGKDGVVLLDVRSAEEFKEGYIPGALLFPLDTIQANIETAYPNKGMTYLIYCRSGNRSKQAANIMVELGYTAVFDIGGINSWPYEIEK